MAKKELAKQAGHSVFQKFSLIPTLNVAQNTFPRREPKRGPFIDHRAMRRDAVCIFAKLEFDIDLQALTVSLSRARQQMVEFAKAYHGDLSVLILDEPTAPLTDLKVGQLFDFIERFKVDRVGIIYISHRMQECARIANRIPHAARRRQDRNCEYGRHRQHRSGRDDDRPQHLG